MSMNCGSIIMDSPTNGLDAGWRAKTLFSPERNAMITVMGATGNIGRKITELLLDAGEEVRALGRSPDKLAELDALGAETVDGDVRDASYLAGTFTGADAVYTLTALDPTMPDYHADQDRRGEAIVAA